MTLKKTAFPWTLYPQEKEAPAHSKAKAKAKALKAKKAELKGVKSHTQRTSACHQPFPGPTLWLRRQHKSPPPGDTGFTMLPSSYPPVHQRSPAEDGRERHTCVHCGCRCQQAPGLTGCEGALPHWHGQGQQPAQAWWGEEGKCSPAFRIWSFGGCQLNWDPLNWVQLANAQHTNFTLWNKQTGEST